MHLVHYKANASTHSWLTDALADTLVNALVGSDSLPLPFSGIPQGSMLGPLPFLIYINDFPDSIFLVDYMQMIHL